MQPPLVASASYLSFPCNMIVFIDQTRSVVHVQYNSSTEFGLGLNMELAAELFTTSGQVRQQESV